MARFKFGRPISLRWNGLLIEGPAETTFEIPDEYYEEFNEDIGGVEPTLVWLDSDEGATLRARVTALEAGGGGGGASLSSDLPLALGTAAAGTGTEASRDDHVHPTTGLALSGHNHDASYSGISHNHTGVYDPAGTAASAVAAHEALSDPHPTYLTATEGNAAYATTGHNHSGVYDLAGTAASAVSTHEAASDPHPTYLTATEGNAAYASTGHNHSGVYANSSHTHAQGDVTNLVTDLAGKAATVHTHATSDVTSGNFVATVTGGTGVTVTSGTGNASAPTVAIGQAVATSSNVQFNNVQADGYVKIPNIIHSQYSLGGSANAGTTITTAGTYYALTSQEVSFTPAFVGQKFLVTYTGSVWINTTTIQYTFIRVDVTDSSNTQIAALGFTRAENFGTSNKGMPVAFTTVWTADSTSTRKVKLYGTNQTTNGLTLTNAYTSLNVVAIA